MQTRRQILRQALALPFVLSDAGANESERVQLICGPDCLSQESAEGFRSVLMAQGLSNLVVVCGANATTDHALCLRERAFAGAWIVWEISPARRLEEQEQILEELFGISVAKSVTVSAGYVSYSWPLPALTRSFLRVIPPLCASHEVIARYGDTSVAAKRQIGRGGIVFLGSMLGPNIRAEEREARQIATAICRSLT